MSTQQLIFYIIRLFVYKYFSLQIFYITSKLNSSMKVISIVYETTHFTVASVETSLAVIFCCLLLYIRYRIASKIITFTYIIKLHTGHTHTELPV